MTQKSLKIVTLITFMCISIAAIIITSCGKKDDATKTTASDPI
jgi:hypothetical protein